MTARSERDRERATCVRKEEGERAKQFHVPLVGIIGASLFETFFSNFEMVKKVGCDLCMLKITKTHDFVAKNFEIKNFSRIFCNEINYGFGERTCTASTRGVTRSYES